MSAEQYEPSITHESLWHYPSGERHQLITNKKAGHERRVDRIATQIEQQFGDKSREAIAARIVQRLDLFFTDLAATQLKNFNPHLADISWLAAAPEQAMGILEVIRDVEMSPEYSLFREEAPEFCACLEVLARLVVEKDGAAYLGLARELDQHLKKGWTAGEPGLSIPFDDTYVDPNRPEGAVPVAWIANAQLLFHYDAQKENLLNERSRLVWSQLEDLHHTAGNAAPQSIVGQSVIGLGTELFSQAIGQSMETGGFIFAINNLAKREPFFQALRSTVESTAPSELGLIWLFIIHELGHNFDKLYEKKGSTDSILQAELRNDLAAIIISLEKKLASDDEIISGSIIEAVSGVLEDTPEEEAVFKGYTLSGIVILNLLFETHCVVEVEPNHFKLQLNVSELIAILHKTFDQVTSEKTRAYFLQPELRPDAQRLVNQINNLSTHR